MLVAPGTYYEDINFNGKIITVTSEQGAAATVIDAGGKPAVVTFTSGETRNAVLSGFTITGGRTIYSGAGISVSFSSPTIRDNVIAGNSGCSGVGIDSYFSSPRIENNTITRNIMSGCTGGWGIGIYVGGNSAAEIIGNVITDNRGEAASGGGVALFAAGNAVLIGNVIARNATAGAAGCGWGGGVAIANFVQAKIVNNLDCGQQRVFRRRVLLAGIVGQHRARQQHHRRQRRGIVAGHLRDRSWTLGISSITTSSAPGSARRCSARTRCR